jgi:hypothetical protein
MEIAPLQINVPATLNIQEINVNSQVVVERTLQIQMCVHIRESANHSTSVIVKLDSLEINANSQVVSEEILLVL